MSIVNKHDLKSELGVEIVERTLEGLGYTMAHTKEKYSPYDLMVTKLLLNKIIIIVILEIIMTDHFFCL